MYEDVAVSAHRAFVYRRIMDELMGKFTPEELSRYQAAKAGVSMKTSYAYAESALITWVSYRALAGRLARVVSARYEEPDVVRERLAMAEAEASGAHETTPAPGTRTPLSRTGPSQTK